MVKLTKLFCVLVLCLLGVASASAGEKVYATFANPQNTAATWDSETSSFSWAQSYYNQIGNIGLPTGDISDYKKLVVDYEIQEGDQFRILFYQGGSNIAVYVTKANDGEKGVKEINIYETLSADANYSPDYILNCSEIKLSGAGGSGKVKINSMYLETYDEGDEKPNVKPEEDEVDPGKPAGDFVDFTTAFPELSPRIGIGADSHPIKLGNGDVVVGQRSNAVIADLSAYSKLTIVTSPNLKLVLYMNHEVAAQQNAGDYAAEDAGKYVFMDVQADENGLIEVDLTQFDKQDLNCICLPWDNSNKGTVWYLLLTQKPYENKTIGLVPGPWAVDGATFAAYAWNADGNAWFPFVEVSGAYATQIPENYTGIILTRINPEGTDTDPWKNVWNQTADIDFTAVANNAVITITGWNAEDYTISAPVDLATAKAQLTAAIEKAKALNAYANDDTLAAAIAVAEEALTGDDAATIVAAATGLQDAAIAAAKTVLQKAVNLATTFGFDASAAQAVLAMENPSADDLQDALNSLLTNAIPEAKKAVADAKSFFNTFDKTAAAALAEDFAKAEAALEGTDINAMIEAANVLLYDAKPAAKAAMYKVFMYVELIDDATLNADADIIRPAVEADNVKKMIDGANQLKADFPAAVDRYITKVEELAAGGEANGKNGVDELKAAIETAKTAIAAAKESDDIVAMGEAVRKLVLVVEAYKEANIIYTVAGNADFLGDWNVTANVLTLNAEGIYAITFENVQLEQGYTVEYKIVMTDYLDNKTWIPAGDNLTYEVWQGTDTYNVTFTYDPATNEAKCAMVPVGMLNLIADAEALAAEDGVAVGKLEEAIEKAKAGNINQTELQKAIDQYMDDNADQEKDETAKVATNGWKKFDGSAAGVCSTDFAPAITTYDGRENVKLAEVYEGNAEGVNRTGTIIYQDITGLTNGKYKVGFYGNAFFTSGRGFDSTMEDGANDVAYVFANDQKEFIIARVATSTTENNFRQFDVEVTDGQIKLGMGKDKAGTNWHTMQIYQLTWFTTAKEVFAQDQEELKAVIAEAKALLADENKTEGKEALEFIVICAEQAVDSKMINISELEAVIGNLKYSIDYFKKANWYIDFAAGEYYIIDVESGLKMAAGHDYGTRGIVNEAGLDLTLTPYSDSRTVTIDSRVYFNDNRHFLGQDLYMDGGEWGWALEYQGFGFYILEPNSGKYINIDANNNLVLSDTPREFIIVTKDGVRAQLLEELSVATKNAPVDATGLITANNFNRGDARNAEAWQWTPSETAEENPDNWNNHNFSGGNEVNNCAESYHAAFNVMQTISDAPAGFYQLTAQGFYRQDNYEGELPAAPQFFANEVNADVPAKAGSENSMSDASASFTNGLYTIDPINFEVKDDGMMYIGITASTNTQWVIWDNFQLKYFGTENPTVGISNVVVETVNNGAIYNLNGQKVMNARKGLYIVNGKKVVLK